MRIVDVMFRQGHLSDAALSAVAAGEDRPEHLDSCGICSRRLHELVRWLDAVRSEAVAAADEAFPPERLAAQQAQIFRRLEQLDEPTRVITFPASTKAPRVEVRRRVAPAWVGVAAAAGLVIGVIGGQVSARLASSGGGQQVEQPQVSTPASSPASQPSNPAVPVNVELLDYDYERYVPDALAVFDEITPALTQDQYAAR